MSPPPTAFPLADYIEVAPRQLIARVEEVRRAMGSKLLLLGHHYQRDEILDLCDLRGDSFQLARMAAENETCEAIVFCGVHFMAETADVLANRPEHAAARGGEPIPVVLPDPTAGCSLAEMASPDQVQRCWREIGEVIDASEITPITYVNSSAALKAFCGARGGIVCTSSNAKRVLEWTFAQRDRVLFFPDQHLGRNTALRMGVAENEAVLWDPSQIRGGVSDETIAAGRIFLWKGCCDIHQQFNVDQITAARAVDPKVRVIVHPECCRAVVDAADEFGSTGGIIAAVEAAPVGTHWVVGTERRLVERLARQHPDQRIDVLGGVEGLCPTMSQITLSHLAWALENLQVGSPVGLVRVDPAIAADALKSLMRMLEVA